MYNQFNELNEVYIIPTMKECKNILQPEYYPVSEMYRLGKHFIISMQTFFSWLFSASWKWMVSALAPQNDWENMGDWRKPAQLPSITKRRAIKVRSHQQLDVICTILILEMVKLKPRHETFQSGNGVDISPDGNSIKSKNITSYHTTLFVATLVLRRRRRRRRRRHHRHHHHHHHHHLNHAWRWSAAALHPQDVQGWASTPPPPRRSFLRVFVKHAPKTPHFQDPKVDQNLNTHFWVNCFKSDPLFFKGWPRYNWKYNTSTTSK